ncbi:hypothetical protein OKW34_001751 [Paraburkholderia youngii]
MAQAAIHLFAAAFAEQAPRAEVFAVVGQQAIAVFAEAGARAAHCFGTDVDRARRRPNRHRMASGEARQFDFLDRAAMRGTRKARVVHDAAVAGIDAVMFVAIALRNQMRADRQIDRR